jgi:hypothetical protein
MGQICGCFPFHIQRGSARVHLGHDTDEGPAADHVQWEADQQLVEEGRHCKDERAGPDARHARAQGREVDVAQHPFVHGRVPQPPVVADGRCIPPVLQRFLLSRRVHVIKVQL